MRKAIFSLLALFLVSSYIYPYPAEDVYNLTGNDYFPEVKRLLGSAKKSIYISMYIASYHPDYPRTLPNQLLQELVTAKKRGLEVKVILDQGKASSPKGQYNDMAYFFLKESGVDVNYDIPATKLHDKLIIIDERIVIIGSHNWSAAAFKKNSEASVVIKSHGLASEFTKWFHSIQVSSRRTPPPEVKTPGVYIPIGLLTNPKLAVNFADSTFKLYLYLIKKWEGAGQEVIILDYLDTARLLNLDKLTKRLYRKKINYLLYILQDRYKLISVKTGRRKPAEIILLDYKNRRKPLTPDPRGSFIVPGSFWEFGWIKRLSRPAKYFYFIGLIETALTTDPSSWWSQRQKYLRRKYHLHSLYIGILELNRYNLLAVEYGQLIYPFDKYLSAPRYLLFPLYSWEWHQEQIQKLEELYGQEKVIRARNWASVVLEENNLEAIEKLINYANQYGETIIRYAVDKVSRRRIGNPKRRFLYMEAIIIGEAREREQGLED